jgi:hypothetical protein
VSLARASVHGFDVTFATRRASLWCAPSPIRSPKKVLAAAHEQAIAATTPGSPGLLDGGGGVVAVADGCGSP